MSDLTTPKREPEGPAGDQSRWTQASEVLARPGSLRIHMIAIGGTGMAPLACLLRALGHDVVGSDGPLYPPMSDLLARAGVEPMVGFDAAHLETEPRPDLVIVGNAVPRHNVEAEAASSLGLAHISMPEAVGHFLLQGRRSLVATGTHGKTTTSTMAAWVLRECGADPGYLVGGAPLGMSDSFALGSGTRFVLEGDEYNAAFFDRGPKFLHYRAQTVLLTSVEYDHVDLYPDAESFKAAFARLIASLPEDGLLVACWDTPAVRSLAAAAPCHVVGYSARPELETELKGTGDLSRVPLVTPVASPTTDESGTSFEVEHEGMRYQVALRLSGEHNVANALAVWCAALADGHSPDRVAAALSSFAGVKRRLEVRGEENGVLVIDDFAHHPTEVAASLGALRARYPKRRLVALFEPRSLSAGRREFGQAYERALCIADVALIAPVFHAHRLSDDERLDLDQLVAALERGGVAASRHASVLELIDHAEGIARPGDVLVTMSSGAFGDGANRLLAGLSARD